MKYQINVNPRIELQSDDFFSEWVWKPTQAEFSQSLNNSEIVVVAQNDNGLPIGFASAITDGSIASFIPFIEVKENFRGLGVGSAMMIKLLHELESFYSTDLVCDEGLVPFYHRFDFKRNVAMTIRRAPASRTNLAGNEGHLL